MVIPCYNRAGSIARAIDSVLAQTFPCLEVIVVDDGSSDDSAGVAASFNSPVRVIRQSNAGAAAARNRGIEAARGQWIGFLDSDDRWHPEFLEQHNRALDRFPDATLSFCDTEVVGSEGVLMPSRFALGGLRGRESQRDGTVACYDRSLFTAMLSQSRVITSAVMVHKNLARLKFPEDIWGSEDWALWLRLVLHHRFVSVDRVLVTMYAMGDNLTGNTSRLMRNDVLVLEQLCRDEPLTDAERREIDMVLASRRAAAVYHSLVSGEPTEARQMLAAIDPRSLALSRRWLYRGACCLPGWMLQRIARLRLSTGRTSV